MDRSTNTRVWLVLCCLMGSLTVLHAQNPFGNSQQGSQGGQGTNQRNGKTVKDSLHHRTGLEDTLTLTFRYLDSTHVYKLDTTVNDFDRFYPLPSYYRALSNTGNAAESLIFTPNFQAGWDPGFHAYDIYRFNWDNTRFFTTTRPYTEALYLTGTSSEQDISVLHTQNINQHWNFAFQYRLTGGPGEYKSQKANENNYRIYTWYESPRKRYHFYGGFIYNNLKSEENGGFVSDTDLNSTVFTNRFYIPTKLGGLTDPQANIFNTALSTGTHYTDFQFLIRNQYDLGQQDSVEVNDSTTYYLFYARLRAQQTLQVNTYTYSFIDELPDSSTHFYQKYYGFLSTPLPGFLIEDKWTQLINDFSLFQYPVARNPSQYLTEGISLEDLKGTFFKEIRDYYNVFVHGEYRNQTRNKKWDVELNGKLYLEGYNVGNYQLFGSLSRTIGKKVGYLEVGFQTVNRTPSFVYQPVSSFNFVPPVNLDNEINSQLFAYFWQPLLKLKLGGHYYVIDNYTYLKGYTGPTQDRTLFNLLQVSAEKEFHLGAHWAWYLDAYFQQATGAVPVHVPLIFTRDRLAYEGRFYRKLNLSTGLEFKYASPFKEDNYSPLLGQFFPQDQTVIYNRPVIDAFVQLRIRTFYLVTRVENLNTLTFTNGFGFKAVNQSYIGYGDPGLVIHFGVIWGFVN